MVAAIAARLALAATRPLWHDEIFTTWASRMSPRALVGTLRHDSGPPLFYLLEKPFVRLAEKSAADALVRALPFLAVLALFAAAAKLSRGAARVWFLVLAAVSPALLLYAAEGRAYGLLAALDLAIFLLLFCGRPTAGRLAAGGAAAAAALWTHYLALFFLAAAGLLLVATRRWRAAGALAAGGLLFLPWIPVLLAQPREATAWIHEPAGRSAQMFLAALGGSARVPLPVGVPLPPALLFASAAVGAALAVSLAIGSARDPELRDAVLLTGGTLVLLLAASLFRPVAVAGRSEMTILPIWLWAVAMSAAVARPTRFVAAAAVAGGILTSAWTLAAERPEPPPARVARLLARVVQPTDRVIASTAFYLPIRLATDRGEIRGQLRAFPPDLADHPGWFVPAPPPRAAYEALPSDLSGVPSGGRVFLVAHPLWAGPQLDRVLSIGGTVREMVREPDALVVVWSPARREGGRPASGVAARDREQRKAERGR